MSAPVERIREAVQVAQGVQSIDGRALLADPATTSDPAVVRLRGRLQRRRHRATLRHQHRAARRRERAEDHSAEMADRGQRALRARQVSTSPARRAANLQRLQVAVILVAVPVIVALGSASTTAVHAFMTEYASASARVAWAVEPGIITLVSGIIIVRSLMRIYGAVPPASLAWIERGALASSVVMCGLGSGPGAVVAPIGVAVVALAVERILTGIAEADLDGGAHTGNPGAHTVTEEERGRVRAEATAEGDAAIAQLAEWRERGSAIIARERTRTQSMAAAAGGATRALLEGARTRDEQEVRAEGRTPEPVRAEADDEPVEREIPVAEAKRLEGLATRARIRAHTAAHPAHTAEEIARAVGVSASTVRRHLNKMRAAA